MKSNIVNKNNISNGKIDEDNKKDQKQRDDAFEYDDKKRIKSKEPEFFNDKFILISNTICLLLSLYIMFTSLLYYFNYSSSVSNLKEYDNLLHSNHFVNFTFTLLIVFHLISLKTKTTYLYIVISTSLFAMYFFYVSNVKAHVDYSLYLQTLKVFILTIATSLITYMTYSLISNIIFLRNFLSKNVTFDQVYHEISLRTDMMKFSYNNLVITLKLNKIFPSLLYKKSDFYYLSCRNNNTKNVYRELKKVEDDESVHIGNFDYDEKQKFISKSNSSKYAYLSTIGEY